LPSTVERLHRELSGSGLSVLAVNIEESRARVSTWARDNGVTMPILLDADGETLRRYGVIATPTVFLIDRQGRLLGRVVGPRDWSTPAAKALIAGLLATSSAH
jgi:peroxiredoxin